jgi:dTDP-glucose pyrophosphorylase
MQPVAFSRELLPAGSARDEGRPRPLADHLVDRLAAAGATRICFVVPAGSTEAVERYGAEAGKRPAAYVVQPRPRGLCDAVFRALPLIGPEDQVLIVRPDAVWFPEHALRALGDGGLSFLCFPVAEPERFEAVLSSDDGEVREIRVEQPDPGSRWIWGAFKLDGATLRALHDLFCERDREDERVGTLVSAWIARGGAARAVRAGEVYLDATLR